MFQRQVCDLRCAVASLSDQNKLLRTTQVNSNERLAVGELNIVEDSVEIYKDRIRQLEDSLSESLILIDNLQSQSLNYKEFETQKKCYDEKCEELRLLQSDQDDLLELLAYQDEKLKRYRKKLSDLGDKVSYGINKILRISKI